MKILLKISNLSTNIATNTLAKNQLVDPFVGDTKIHDTKLKKFSLIIQYLPAICSFIFCNKFTLHHPAKVQFIYHNLFTFHCAFFTTSSKETLYILSVFFVIDKMENKTFSSLLAKVKLKGNRITFSQLSFALLFFTQQTGMACEQELHFHIELFYSRAFLAHIHQ